MAHLADELEYAAEERRPDDPNGHRSSIPEIVNDPRALRLVPWGGEGPDPLDAEAADA